MSSELVTVLASFGAGGFGALLGSASAFLLGRLAQMRDERRREHSSLLSTQFALISQWNNLESVRKDLLEPHRSEEDRHKRMPFFEVYGDSLTVDYGRIDFICNSEQPDLLQQIHIAELSYQTALQALHARNRAMAQICEKSKIREFDSSTGLASGHVPMASMYVLKRRTDFLYEAVDRALPKLEAEWKALHRFSKETFPKWRALELTPVSEAE